METIFDPRRFQSETVSLMVVKGKWIHASNLTPPATLTKESIDAVVRRQEHIEYFPNDPARMGRSFPPTSVPTAKWDEIPSEVGAPLKTENSPFSSVRYVGYRSGKRSCVVCVRIGDNGEIGVAKNSRNQWLVPDPSGSQILRIKGCGMWTQDDKVPYPSTTLHTLGRPFNDTEIKTLRGFCFPETAANESFITTEVDNMLDKMGMVPVAVPVGMWLYDEMEGDPAPLVPRACCVLETTSDKRGENHFMTGLEMLLADKLTDDVATSILSRATTIFGKHGRPIPSEANKPYTRVDVSDTQSLGKTMNSFLGKLDALLSPNSHTDFSKQMSHIPAEDILSIFSEEQSSDVDMGLLSELVYLFGWEGGKCMTAIHRAGYVWGSFCNLSTMEAISNAHLDNLVVLPSETIINHKQLISPIDFDSSYAIRRTVDLFRDQPCESEDYAESWLVSEFRQLLGDMGGAQAETACATITSEPRRILSGPKKDFLWILRELAVCGALLGYTTPLSTISCLSKPRFFENIANLTEQILDYSRDINS